MAVKHAPTRNFSCRSFGQSSGATVVGGCFDKRYVTLRSTACRHISTATFLCVERTARPSSRSVSAKTSMYHLVTQLLRVVCKALEDQWAASWHIQSAADSLGKQNKILEASYWGNILLRMQAMYSIFFSSSFDLVLCLECQCVGSRRSQAWGKQNSRLWDDALDEGPLQRQESWEKPAISPAVGHLCECTTMPALCHLALSILVLNSLSRRGVSRNLENRTKIDKDKLSFFRQVPRT